MQIFVTGGTGLVGQAVVAELVGAGHEVVALARSHASADIARASGAEPIRGALADLEVLRAVSARVDGVIHLAFDNDFSSPESVQSAISEESHALATIGEALAGTDRPLVTVSGTPIVADRPSKETDPLPTDGLMGGRARSVTDVLDLASRRVRASAVRLPRTVHLDGQGGFAGLLTDAARRTGVAGYPADGSQRWPAVHAIDAAVLFRMALERAPAGSSWHAVADPGDKVRDMAQVIGRRLELPVRALPMDAFGPLGPMFATDQPSSSDRTRAALGWIPRHARLLVDLENLAP